MTSPDNPWPTDWATSCAAFGRSGTTRNARMPILRQARPTRRRSQTWPSGRNGKGQPGNEPGMSACRRIIAGELAASCAPLVHELWPETQTKGTA